MVLEVVVLLLLLLPGTLSHFVSRIAGVKKQSLLCGTQADNRHRKHYQTNRILQECRGHRVQVHLWLVRRLAKVLGFLVPTGEEHCIIQIIHETEVMASEWLVAFGVIRSSADFYGASPSQQCSELNSSTLHLCFDWNQSTVEISKWAHVVGSSDGLWVIRGQEKCDKKPQRLHYQSITRVATWGSHLCIRIKVPNSFSKL